MRRRHRIDLGSTSGRSDQSERNQEGSSTTRDDERRERKRQRWATVNKNKPPEENPFLAAIKPNHDNYGDPGETTKELRARLESLEFGNYPGYFNYRNKAATITTATDKQPPDSNSESRTANHNDQTGAKSSLEDGLSDERLRLMKEEWFRGKDVLDIGCNRGHVTYAIAKLFSPRSILGIDIDLKMINMANRDLHHHLESDIIRRNIDFRVKRAHKLTTSPAGDELKADDGEDEPSNSTPISIYTENDLHFPVSSYVARGPLAVSLGHMETNCYTESTPGTSSEIAAEDNKEEKSDKDKLNSSPGAFPNNVLFVEHNYVLSKDELVDRQKAHFDAIICLSVTKWIHLNYRDEGLKRFFKRIHKHLNESGLLVLEAQPFDNYHRKKKLSERLRSNFQSIKFKPDQFDEFLLSEEVGFKRIIFSSTTEHECAGFKRPMKVFLK